MKKDKKNLLWYQQSAERWIEALPLGNGRIGAMVYGGGLEEKIQIDESTFWSGEASADNNVPGTRALMEQIREALLKGDYDRADELGHNFVGRKNQYGTNMPTGELKIRMQEKCERKELQRYLDLEESLAETTFCVSSVNPEEDCIQVRRECFVSNPAQVFCMAIEADREFSTEIRYDGIGTPTSFSGFDGEFVRIKGDARENLHSNGKTGVHLEGCMKLDTDGETVYEAQTFLVKKATYIMIYLDLETTMFESLPYEKAKKRVKEAAVKGYETCKKEHIEDVKKLFDRMDLSLGQEELHLIPTDIRIARAIETGMPDTALCALMYQYGRYLLIASSREDSPLPTHMGGIWNDNIYNNIDCTQDMHIDMNLQMQYWASAMCNLPECYQPFFHYIEKILIPSGTRTAREAYEMDGWTAHVVSNPWGFTSLGWAYNWGVWSLGGVWASAMVWDYYEYTGDRQFLKERGFSMVEGAVRFVLDYVFKDEKTGYYMTGPSYSPENQFAVDEKNYFLALSNTCDVILVREILDIYQKACRVLEMDTILLQKAGEVLENLPPYQIGKKGQLQEWFYDFEEPIPNHRHTSHLLGVYPFQQIDPERDRDLTEGARQSIRLRHENFEITSWGMNMLLGYYARFGDAKEAANIINETFAKIVRPNMASVMDDEKSMWRGTWELDGNTGFTAAMSELFIQSRERGIFLLPALPPQWKCGYLKGIRVRNCGTADIYWEKGKLLKAVFYVETEGQWEIRYAGNRKVCNLLPGDVLEMEADCFGSENI